MKKYIIKLEHLITMVPVKKTRTTYVSQLNTDLTISCSKNINLAYVFESYEVAWLIAKTKVDNYFSEWEVTIMEVE